MRAIHRPAVMILAIFLVTSSLGNAHAVGLRGSVVVDAEMVRLGDLFTVDGDLADTFVAAAPLPGRKEIYGTMRLVSIAYQHKLRWSPQSRYDRVLVERSGRPVDRSEIEEKVKEALVATGMPSDRKIVLATRRLSLYVPTGSTAPLRVQHARLQMGTGRFTAIVEVPTGPISVQRIQVRGKALTMVDVPVLARQMRRGDVIGENDLVTVVMTTDALKRDTILDKEEIIGKTPRRLLRNGLPLRTNDLRRPVVVAKGTLVMLVVKTERMLLTTRGRALHNAARGDVVKVINTHSNATVEGIVIGPNRVKISYPGAGE